MHFNLQNIGEKSDFFSTSLRKRKIISENTQLSLIHSYRKNEAFCNLFVPFLALQLIINPL